MSNYRSDVHCCGKCTPGARNCIDIVLKSEVHFFPRSTQWFISSFHVPVPHQHVQKRAPLLCTATPIKSSAFDQGFYCNQPPHADRMQHQHIARRD